jgi:N-acetylglutamate synthase-like GNAT family acetyltransferase
MKIRYRVVTKDDEENLVILMQNLGYKVDNTLLAIRVQELHNQGSEIFVAELSGIVIGCVNAIIDIRLAEGKFGEIVSLVVSEKYRGYGVGKGLVQYAESWLRKRCSTIRVRANAMRSEAHAFYQTLGYQEIKTQKIFIKNV